MKLFERIKPFVPYTGTPDLGELPALWAALESKYPPSDGWGLKIVRRWLGTPNDGAVWIVDVSRSGKSGREEDTQHRQADGISPAAAMRDLLSR